MRDYIDPFYQVELVPKFLPEQYVQIRGEYYKILEVRPAFSFDYKEVEISSKSVEVDFKEKGLVGKEGELLDVRLSLFGPCTFEIRIEGSAGPVVGGYGGKVKLADERTSKNLLQFLIFEDRVGWLWMRITPIIVPAWFKVRAEGFVYLVEKVSTKPKQYSIPPFIAYPVA